MGGERPLHFQNESKIPFDIVSGLLRLRDLDTNLCSTYLSDQKFFLGF